ncbi:MAG: acyl-CoA dehydrogenase [Pseudomonadales bacterium]|nr:acyl-CoA dehydrogenase [Pseudomonadales bacterium]
MLTYEAPLDDIHFLLHDLFEVSDVFAQLSEQDALTPDLMDSVLSEMAKFAGGVLLPANSPGDKEGCSYDPKTKSVTTPAAYKAPFKQFVEAGWTSLAAPVEHGGQGLPKLLGVVFDEMCAATNTSLSMYFGLTHGAIVALEKHASAELKDRYLEPLIAGKWTGTMCLTEPHCGTDLGLIKTRAEPASEGHYRLNGAKIWISGGEQDLSENIIHLVLAKLPDAPAGTKGISLFLVPKFLPDGKRNGIFCTGLEHKMGIKGSATCFMSLEDAEGYLIGEPHSGLKYMFSMMNSARLMVGVQGLGLGETAYQTALSFAKERAQGRSLSGAKEPDKPADNILVHPDVRRMLLSQKASLEGGRALAYWVGLNLDISERHPDEAERQRAHDLVELLTPVVKAFLTDQGYYVCDQAVQTLGGSGFTEDWGIEQLLRDCRISRIYEGTNGIQALDFVGRKLPMAGGRAVRTLLAEVAAFVEQCRDETSRSVLQQAVSELTETLTWLTRSAMQDPEIAGAAATPLLRMFGLALTGYLLARSADVAAVKLEQGDSRKAFLESKVLIRDFYFLEFMPQVTALKQSIVAGKDHLMQLPAEDF